MGINQVKIKRAAEDATLASLSTQAARVVIPFTSRFNGQTFSAGTIIPVGGLVKEEFDELAASEDIYPLLDFVGRLALSDAGPFYVGPLAEFCQDNEIGETEEYYTLAVEVTRFSGEGEAEFTLNIEGFTYDSGVFTNTSGDFTIKSRDAEGAYANTVTLNDDTPTATLYLEFVPVWPNVNATLNISLVADNVVNSPLTASVVVHVGATIEQIVPFRFNQALTNGCFGNIPPLVTGMGMKYSIVGLSINTPVVWDVESSIEVGVTADHDKYAASTVIPAPDGTTFTDIAVLDKTPVVFEDAMYIQVYLVKGEAVSTGYSLLKLLVLVWE